MNLDEYWMLPKEKLINRINLVLCPFLWSLMIITGADGQFTIADHAHFNLDWLNDHNWVFYTCVFIAVLQTSGYLWWYLKLQLRINQRRK